MPDHPGKTLVRVLFDLQTDLFTSLERRQVGFTGIELKPQAGRVGDDKQRVTALLWAKLQPGIQVALDNDAGQRTAQGVGTVAGATQPGQAPAGPIRFR
jgi:hypothetical protein